MSKPQKLTPVESAILDLERARELLFVLSDADKPLKKDDAKRISDQIGESVVTIRTAFQRTAQAIRGDLND